MDKPLYRYMAEVINVVDGDTVHIRIDEGFRHYWETSCRLAGINAPEMKTKDGPAAKDYLTQRLPVGTKVYIISKSLDKYGRPIAEIYLNDVLINQELISKGFAVKYM